MAETKTSGYSFNFFISLISITYVKTLEASKEFPCMVTRTGSGVFIELLAVLHNCRSAPVNPDVGLTGGFLSFLLVDLPAGLITHDDFTFQQLSVHSFIQWLQPVFRGAYDPVCHHISFVLHPFF